MTSRLQTITSTEGVELPLLYDQQTKNWGVNLPDGVSPRATFDIGNIHPDVDGVPQDTRLTVSTHKRNGTRAAITQSGPDQHFTMAMGQKNTGGLGEAWGIGNNGHYAQTIQVSQFTKLQQAVLAEAGQDVGYQCYVDHLNIFGNTDMTQLILDMYSSLSQLHQRIKHQEVRIKQLENAAANR